MKISFEDMFGLTEIKKKLDDISKKADEILAGQGKNKYVTPELERLIRQVSAIAKYIEKKVP